MLLWGPPLDRTPRAPWLRALLHLEALVPQSIIALHLQCHGVARFELSQGGMQRLHGLDGSCVQLMNHVPSLKTGFGPDEISGSAQYQNAGGDPQRADCDAQVRGEVDRQNAQTWDQASLGVHRV